jgi:hypothetical protein
VSKICSRGTKNTCSLYNNKELNSTKYNVPLFGRDGVRRPFWRKGRKTFRPSDDHPGKRFKFSFGVRRFVADEEAYHHPPPKAACH